MESIGVRELRQNASVWLRRVERSLDAIHVASALLLRADLNVLVSYDARMLDAARAAGIPTAMPS